MPTNPILLKQLFISDVMPQLFPSGTFIAKARIDDAYVNYDQVNLPNAGTIPGVQVNRTILPAQINQRTDIATSYPLEELTVDPTVLTYSEELLVNYNKRADLLEQQVNALNTKAGDRCLVKWATGATVFNSTGVTDGGTALTRTASGPSQTGTRKQFGKDDLVKIRQRFFKDNVLSGNVDVSSIAVLTSEQYGDLIGLPNVSESQKYGRATFPTGVVDRIVGFDIYIRSRVLVTDSSYVLKAEGAAPAATDNDAAIFYHPMFVRRALGAVKPFLRVDNPEYYGDIFSMILRFGAAAARNDIKGVYVLTEHT